MTDMEKAMIFILIVILYVIWLLCLNQLGGIFFQKRGNSVRKFIFISGFSGLLFLTNLWVKHHYMLGSVAQQLLLILFFSMMFYGDRWEKCGFSTILVSIWEFTWNGTDAVLSIFHMLLSQNTIMPYERGNGYFITIFSFLITAACMYLLFNRTRLAKGNFLRGSGSILCSVTGFLLLLLDLCNFGITRGVVMVSDHGANYWSITHNELLTHLELLVLSALCMVICLSLLFGMNRLITYMTIDRLHKMEISHYQELLEQYQKQANVRHDLKNHLISLATLVEQEEWDKLKTYFEKIYQAGMIDVEEIETGNRVVNAIVNTKRQTARQKNIRFDCSITISKPLLMEEFDLCIIWGNILDNAIKAASATKEPYIIVQAETIKKNFIVTVKNSTLSDIKQEFGSQNWGTGLNNIHNIVQKEHGIMDIVVGHASFEISIMLPVVDASFDRI